MPPISSEMFVRALTRVGFVIYRASASSTILERGTRAIVVPARRRLAAEIVGDLRRMAGLTWREIDELLRDESE